MGQQHWPNRQNGIGHCQNSQPETSFAQNSNGITFDQEQMLKENEINEMFEKFRQPIPPTQGIFLEQNFHETYRPLVERSHDPVFEQFPTSSTAEIATIEQLRAAHHSGLRPNTRMDLGYEIVIDGISNHLPPTQSMASTSNASEKCPKTQRNLKNLYRPPIELMFRGDWDQALELAKKKNMWLLVNVQNALEFASAKLNRDIWSAETVQEIIKANFIFWQVYHDSSDGCRIGAYYSLDNTYPIIFIVDPRTGEEVQRLIASKTGDESSFLDFLTTFLAENPTFESRDRQFVEELTTDDKRQQQQKRINNREQNDGMMSSSSSSSGCWTPAQLINSDEWSKWTVNEADLSIQPCPKTVQLSLRLPNGQMERIRMWKAAPLSAVFSMLLAKGHNYSSNNYQLVLDYPRREFVLCPQNRFSTLDEIGFGPQELIHITTIEN
ncbi:hypothetical protein niasHS_002887 [Heterodera schachtii]|uniref:UBX domain-containing protein n=1 Tax=Heterodera schachtii TaxID=97005 RepID=A0ABD2K9B7_HETSC